MKTKLLTSLLALYTIGYPILVNATELNRIVGQWDLNGNAQDSSGNNLNGISANVTPATDRFGQPNGALLFGSNVSSRVTIPYQPSLNLGSNFGVSMWFKYNQGWSYSDESLIYQYNTITGNGWALDLNQDDGEYGAGKYKLHFDILNSFTMSERAGSIFHIYSSALSVQDITSWNKVSVSMLDGVASMYVNDVLQNTLSFSGQVPSINADIIIGGSINPGDPVTMVPVERSFDQVVITIPEPSAVSLLAVGLGGLAMMRRRRA
jgi:hypothetical protein